jgi:hypothetical protein
MFAAFAPASVGDDDAGSESGSTLSATPTP